MSHIKESRMNILEAVDDSESGRQSILPVVGLEEGDYLKYSGGKKGTPGVRVMVLKAEKPGIYLIKELVNRVTHRLVLDGVKFTIKSDQLHAIAEGLHKGYPIDELAVVRDGELLFVPWETIKGRKEDAKREKLKREIEERISLFSSQSLEFILDYINR